MSVKLSRGLTLIPSVGRPASLTDIFWQVLFRLGFPAVRLWSRLRRRRHQGALVAVYVGETLLLVRSSYRDEWNFPGGGLRRGEAPDEAACRELAEEIGMTASDLSAAGSIHGLWEGRREQVHFFELRLDRLPDLRLDNREIVAARWMAPAELLTVALTGPVASYLSRHGARSLV